MKQYTTPTIELTVKGIDISGADKIWVTFTDTSRAIVVTKDSPTVAASGGDTNITVTLTQAETAEFTADTISAVQVNWMTGNNRYATDIAPISVFENLLKEILVNA